ncbi:MAG: TolC family protein, partial [Pseudomonadota bacterium]
AFSRYRATLQVIDATETAVEANELALEGVRAENSVGLRTILDILNAEQELLTSQVDLVTARRNAYVAGFNLLAAMGQAEAQDLGLDGGVLYDPNVNYERVDDQWFDWNDDPRPVTQSTRTIDNPERVVTTPEN